MATKKPSQLDLLRKLIREEVAKAIREEMPTILEGMQMGAVKKAPIKESVKPKKSIPMTLNTQPFRPQPNFSGNPLASLLNETAVSMTDNDDMAFAPMTTDSVGPESIGVDPMDFFQPKNVAVGDVNGMLQTARGSSDPSMVQINEVPDFTNLMSKMLAKGVM